jgi:hypothetical protein
MRHLVLTIIAIALAGIAAVAATTAMLNAPLRIGPAAGSTQNPAQPGLTQAPASKEIPDAPPPKGAEPQPATPGSAEPASAEPAGAKPPAEGETAEDPDDVPYEGIAPEDLPPDLQYDADASVSFPTNT